MEWFDFVDLMRYMVDTYGVPYGYGEDHEFEFPNTMEDCQDAWFECPECGEPILYCDWVDAFDIYNNWDFNKVLCPICEADWG